MTRHLTLTEIIAQPRLQRPVMGMSFEAQAIALRLDPAGKSPLEERLGYAILELLIDPDEFGPPAFVNLFLPHGAIDRPDEMPPIPAIKEGVINVTPGCWVDAYQADYLFNVKAPRAKRIACAALECDGHEFHEKTPQQVSHDRARDRSFQDLGYVVLRFPGWDVHDHAKDCAREAINVLLRRSNCGGAS